MSLKRLTTGEMLQITTAWVDKKHRHGQLLLAQKELAAFLPHISAAHEALMKTQASLPESGQGLHENMEQVDALHDELVRGLFGLCTALGHLAEKSEDRFAFWALRDRLFPEGLSLVGKSFQDEAGQAQLAANRLTDDDKKRMAACQVAGTTLSALFARYTQTARTLGELSLARDTPEAGAKTRADCVAARSGWIRAVGAVLNLIDLIDPQEELVREVITPLRELEKRASRRRTKPETPEPITSPGGRARAFPGRRR